MAEMVLSRYPDCAECGQRINEGDLFVLLSTDHQYRHARCAVKLDEQLKGGYRYFTVQPFRVIPPASWTPEQQDEWLAQAAIAEVDDL